MNKTKVARASRSLMQASRLLYIAILPMLGSSETYIVPARADLGFAAATVSMPKSEWTNCVFWMDAAAPVFGEGTTNYAIPDLSPARNDATQPNISSQPARVFTNKVWTFKYDGANDHVSIQPNALDLDAPFSISLWVKRNGSPSGSFPALISKGTGDFTTTGSPNHGLIIINVSGTFSFRLSDEIMNTIVESSLGSITDGLWHNLVCVWNGAAAHTYKNAAQTGSAAGAFAGSLNSSSSFTIGRWAQFYRHFNGDIDGVRFYQKALTAGEISLIYDAGKWRRGE